MKENSRDKTKMPKGPMGIIIFDGQFINTVHYQVYWLIIYISEDIFRQVEKARKKEIKKTAYTSQTRNNDLFFLLSNYRLCTLDCVCPLSSNSILTPGFFSSCWIILLLLGDEKRSSKHCS